MALGTVAMGVGNYVLPPATADTLGGVMIGDGLAVDETGKAAFAPDNMSVPLQKALGTQLAGEGLRVDETGKMNVDQTGALACFPVGIVISMVGSTSPAALFGGTWQEIAQNRVLMGASYAHAAGTTVEAGLPNITGQLPVLKNIGSSNDFLISGAFARTNTQETTYYRSGDESSTLWIYRADFNAARSSAVYGRSSTVQPAAYYVHIWHRVA